MSGTKYKSAFLRLRIQPNLKLWLESQARADNSTVSKVVTDILQREQSRELDLSRVVNSITGVSSRVDKLREAIVVLAQKSE